MTLTLNQGVAAFSGLSYDKAETMNITFSTSAGSFAATSSNIAVSPNTASNQLQLVIAQQPSTTATAGANFATQPIVKEEDAFGNVIASDDSSTVTAVRGSLGSASLQGANLTETLNQGMASFGGLFYDVAETMNITFSTSADSATVTSSSIVVSPNTAANQLQLVLAQQPSTTATAGVNFATQPIVKEEDAFGNVITSDNSSTVTAARGTLGSGLLQGTNLTMSLSQGVATFAGLSYDVAETMNITFSTNADSSTVTSSVIVVGASSASQLVFGQQPTTTSAGVAINPNVTVKIEDQFGNVVTADNTDQVTVGIASGPGAFSGSNTVTATASAGLATFSGLVLDTAGTYTLSESATGLTGSGSNSFAVTPNAASKRLVITTQPSSTATAGMNFGTQPVVMEEDAFGNVFTTDSSSTVSAATGTQGTASLQGANLTVTLSQGVATFSGLSYDRAETMNITFRTSAGSFTATSGSIVVSPDTAVNQAAARYRSATVGCHGRRRLRHAADRQGRGRVRQRHHLGQFPYGDGGARHARRGRLARRQPDRDLESRRGDVCWAVL